MLYLNDIFPQRGSIKRVQDVCAVHAVLKDRCSISTPGLVPGDKHPTDPSTPIPPNYLEANGMKANHFSALSGATCFDPNPKSMEQNLGYSTFGTEVVLLVTTSYLMAITNASWLFK